MDKEALTALIDSGLTEREIGSRVGRSQSTVGYWLRKYGLVTKTNKFQSDRFLCKTCGENDVSKFKNAGKGRRCKTVCSSCHNERMTDQYRELKLRGVSYLGGRCVKCGYGKCVAALQFHHRDPAQKDPDWKKLRKHGWDRLKQELDKCELVCANCHAEIHYGVLV